MSDPNHKNRLAAESSPYLLQHAHNPVDWHPWGAESIELARRENKPIFLSVGYSTCYWCHVMERECFENEAIAAQMNGAFVNIKVDREERPDVDQLYMTAVQVMTQQGGWPMSVFLTPDLEPFFAGTYFPPADRFGRPGFPKVLAAVADAFKNRRDEVDQSADQLTAMLRKLARPHGADKQIRVDLKWVTELLDRTVSDFDEQYGGFGTAPKFPRETLLELILVYLRAHPNLELLRMLTRSLDAMLYGGIRDHLGGGFHRYSTDARWLVPHFEIMLYDNAMLLWIYAEAYQQTGEVRYAAAARGIVDFVLRELTADSGAFFTALDAEVDGREGANYLWTREEAVAALQGKADAGKFSRVYGLDEGPNFSDPHHNSGVAEKNVLFLAEPESGAALFDEELERARRILYQVRRQRKQPRLDNKILTSWNALMIRGLAHAGEILKEPKYVQAAEKCANYLLKVHRAGDGGLLRAGIDGSAKQPAFLDDYAFLIQALLALPGEARRAQAAEFAAIMRDRFSAGVEGGFFYTDERATDLIVRQMVGSDSPLPSGNGVAALTLMDLSDWTNAESTISTFAGQMDSVAEGMSALVQVAFVYVEARGEITPQTSGERLLSPVEFAGRVVEISAARDASVVRIRCRVADGYHLNAHDAAALPTRLAIRGAPTAEIRYPSGELRGDFEIEVKLKLPSAAELEATLSYQACNDTACLPRTSRTVKIPAAV